MASKTSEESKTVLIYSENENQSKTSGKKGKTQMTRHLTFDDLNSIETIDVCNEWKGSECSHFSPTIKAKCEKCSSKTVTTSSSANNQSKKFSKPKPVVTPEICSLKTKTKGLQFVYESSPPTPKPAVAPNIGSIKTKKNESQFVDDSFPPKLKSLFFKGGKNKGRVTQWLRPNQIKDDENPLLKWRIFRNPKPSDICQGEVGDCWLLSALSVFATKPGRVRKLFIDTNISPEGCYQIRLFKNGKAVTNTIDDTLPCDKNGRLVYSKAKRRQLWMPLIEKAAAKMYGCYEALDGGSVWEGLSILTGSPSDTIQLHSDAGKLNFDIIWGQLLKNKKAKYLMATETNDIIFKKVGLVYNHAYAIIDVRAIDGNRLIHLCDPYGNPSWNGNWSDRSPLWTPKLRKELMPNGLTDGMFWIEFKDFLKFFGSVIICKVRPKWCKTEISGVFPNNAFDTQNMTSVVLTAVKRTKIELVLYQRGFRGLSEEMEVLDSCLAVFSWNGSKLGKLQKCSVRKLHDFVTCDLNLKPGVYIVVNMAFNHFNERRQIVKEYPEYLLAIHSVTPLDVKGITPPTYILADALIAITIANGEKSEFSDKNGIYGNLYCLTKDWSGLSAVVENRDPNLCLKIIYSCSQSEDIVSTRGVFKIDDTIPPLHKQLVMHLTETYPDQEHQFIKSIEYFQVANCDKKSEHFPLLNKSTLRLHSPRSL